MKKITFIPILVSLFLTFSCATYNLENRNHFVQNKLIDPYRGGTIEILTPKVKLGRLRTALSLGTFNLNVDPENLEDFSITSVYLMDIDDDYYGTLGIIEENIFKDVTLEEGYWESLVAELLKEGVEAGRDYRAPYIKSFGADKKGVLSNRVVMDDPYAEEAVYGGEPLSPAYEEAFLIQGEEASGKADYVLESKVDIETEIAEVLEPLYSKPSADYPVEEGQFYLNIKVKVSFTLRDREGEKVYSSKDKIDYAPEAYAEKAVLLPVSYGDREAFNKYRESFNYEFILAEILDEAVPYVYPFFNDYYVNYQEKVK
ncbi:MAG: hypothetical protein PQJ59_19040 [Spirochaetales bacterium]|nr:hypothetical protein [Spirochaetales bacterium]